MYKMPLLTGFLYSFPAACHTEYHSDIISNYPVRADGFFSRNRFTLHELLKTESVQNLSPPYFEVVQQSLNFLEKYPIYYESLLNTSSHLVFTYKHTPLLVFENLSIANSYTITIVDTFWLVPHYITDKEVEQKIRGEKRWATLGLLAVFLSYGVLFK